ncbi:MAG: hypothetical protein B7Y00_01800 [Sphingomonadales bacterium 17-56-6]|nr:MAG: hypothetical protein B7Y44_11170 [Sphingomonadales bacterium 28-55-16]OYZ89255.1 MAG: hypothetical protein B7Y00_01800 [Sphingomonadales bacterium 17-56-6]
MFYLVIKTVLFAILIATVSETARRNPATGTIIASLPIISVFGMIWLQRDTQDVARMADHAFATSWYVLLSLAMFLFIPVPLRCGIGFWAALTCGCVLTTALHSAMMWARPRFGLKL